MSRAGTPTHRSVINLHQLRPRHTPRWPHPLWALHVTEIAWTWLVLLRKHTRRKRSLLPPISAPRYGKKLGSLLLLFLGTKSNTSKSRPDKDYCSRIPSLLSPHLFRTRQGPLLQSPQLGAHLNEHLLTVSHQNLRTSTSIHHQISQPVG